MKIYYDKEKAKNQELYCLGINLDEKKLQNFVVYESENIFSGYPIVEDNILRQATLQELVNLGKLVLADGEKIQDNKIVKILQPNYYYKWNKSSFIWEVDEKLLKDGDYLENGTLITITFPVDLVRPKWDKEQHLWEEGATDQEKVQHSLNEYLILNTPLDFEEMEQAGVLEDYKTYIKEARTYLKTRGGEIPQPSQALENFLKNRNEEMRGINE